MCTQTDSWYCVPPADLKKVGILVSPEGGLAIPLSNFNTVVWVRRFADSYRKAARKFADEQQQLREELDALQLEEDNEAVWRDLTRKIGGLTVDEVKELYRRSAEGEDTSELRTKSGGAGANMKAATEAPST